MSELWMATCEAVEVGFPIICLCISRVGKKWLQF